MRHIVANSALASWLALAAATLGGSGLSGQSVHKLRGRIGRCTTAERQKGRFSVNDKIAFLHISYLVHRIRLGGERSAIWTWIS